MMNDLKIERDAASYHVIEVLGEGTYGVVYKAVEITTGRLVALKRTKSDNLKEGISAVNLREICFLKSLRHPGIVTLQSVVVSDKNLDLVFEFLSGDLRAYIDSVQGNVPEFLIKRFLQQVLSALHFCHSNRVIHRDLKPQNLLIDQNINLKIADFGLARSFQIPMRPYTPCVQTLWYRAPEILLGAKSYTTAIDLWSIGCIFSEMVTGEPLFPGKSELDVIYKIFQLNGTPYEETWPGVSLFQYYKTDFAKWDKVTLRDIYPQLSLDALDLLSKLLCMNPDYRISTSDAINHVIFI